MTTHAFGRNVEINIFVAPLGVECRLLIGGLDLSSAVRGLTIAAEAGELTTLSLDLIAPEGMTVEGLVDRLGLTVVTREELLERLTDRDEPT